MIDTTHKTIEELFYKQIRNLSVKRLDRGIDLVFSDAWL